MRCPFPFSRVPPFLLVSISYAPLPFFGIVFFSPFSSPPFSSGKQHMFGDEKICISIAGESCLPAYLLAYSGDISLT